MDRIAAGEAALLYLKAGWHPIELLAGQKEPPTFTKHRTGHEGTDLTATDIDALAWAGNLGIRMPPDVIGLDVDAYKKGLESLRDLIDKLGPLPATYISHNHRNDESGIRFFLVPRMPAWIAGLPGIDIIQRHHRYAAVWPSTHPSGRSYDWWDQTIKAPAEAIPHVDDLPDLPQPWIEELSRDEANGHSRAASGGEVGEFLSEHTRADKPGYVTVICDHFEAQRRAGLSRHDNMQHCLIWAMEHVRAGIAPAQKAVDALGARWVVAVAPDARRAELFSARRTTEFDAMLRHAVGKANAKTEAELHTLHDNVAGIPINATPPTLIGQLQAGMGVADDDMLELVDWNGTADADDELVEGLIIPGRWTQFVAKAKEGKSSLEMFCAIELSEGRHPFDGTAMEPIRVLYLDGEMGQRDLHELIEACGHHPTKLPNLHCSTERPRLDTPKGAARLHRRVNDMGAELVVLDGLNGFVNPEATDNDDNTWKPLYRLAIEPLKQAGVAIISGDNMGKDSAKGSRGSSVKNDKADAVFPVKRTDSGIKLRPSHRRGGNFTDELTLEAEGFDRTRPIRFWRAAASWPSGTKEAVAVLNSLHVPLDLPRRKVAALLKSAIEDAEANGRDPEPFRIRTEVQGAAMRWRRASPIKAGTTPGTKSLFTSATDAGTDDGTDTSSASEMPSDQPEPGPGTTANQ